MPAWRPALRALQPRRPRRPDLALAFALLLVPLSSRLLVAVEDCNGNGRVDEEDIASGTSADCNDDGLPDDCEAVPPPPGSRESIPLPGSPVDLVVESFTRSPGQDLAVITTPEDGFRVSVLSRVQAGAWETVWELDSDLELSRIRAGDLDGDGDRDLALIDTDGIVVRMNDGAGNFDASLPLLARPGVRELELVDLNQDGSMDIVAIDPGAAEVIALVRADDGHAVQIHELPQDSPTGLTVGDWDGDGDPDLAVMTSTSGLAFFSSEGDGTLVLESGPDLGPPGRAIAADLDRDGLEDWLTVRNSSVLFFRNLANLEFDSVGSFQSDLRGQSVLALSPGDFDLDADIDLALILGGRGVPEDLQILENSGNGSFGAAPPLRLTYRPDGVTTGDIDGDGDAEVLLWAMSRQRVDILFDDAPGLTPSERLSLRKETVDVNDNFEPHSTILSDLDGDGDLDLATMDGEDRVRILTNDGAGELTEGETYSLDGASEIISITGADLDDDGDIDIAAVDEQTENLLVLQNRGDATFRQLDEQYGIGHRATFVIAADLDGDGLRDLVCTNSADRDISLLRNRSEARFEPGIEITVGNNPSGVAAGDFDDDGDVDLAVTLGDGVSILLNDGEASFDERDEYEIGPPGYIVSADIDDDGDLDLAAAHEGAERVTVLLNEGDGAFVPSGLEIGQSPRSVIAVDLDGDGQLELVTGNAQQDTVTIIANRGAGRFGPPVHHEVGGAPRFVVGGDLDGDGDADVIAANHDSHTFTLLLNEPAGIPRLTAICTERDFHEVSAPLPRGEIRERLTHYLLPVDPDAPDTLSTLFSTASFRELLPEAFPGDFADLTDEDFDRLVGHRASREYFTGVVYQLRSGREILHGFDVFSDSLSDPAELPTANEVRAVHQALSAAFSFAALVYFPDTSSALEDASSWEDPDFPIFFLTELFRRADASHDGTIDITDPIFVLEYLFLDGEAPRCEKAADANDDGSVDIGDAVTLLVHLFRGTIPIPEPFSMCARDPTPDSLTCREIAPCAGFGADGLAP